MTWSEIATALNRTYWSVIQKAREIHLAQKKHPDRRTRVAVINGAIAERLAVVGWLALPLYLSVTEQTISSPSALPVRGWALRAVILLPYGLHRHGIAL